MIQAILAALGFLALGAAAGACHFVLLRRNVDILAAGGSPLAALGLLAARVALSLAALWLAARAGWPALLACAAGLLAARQAVIGRLARGRP